jgi:hypothetical protein
MPASRQTWVPVSPRTTRSGRPKAADPNQAAQAAVEFIREALVQAEGWMPEVWSQLTEYGQQKLVQELVEAYFKPDPEQEVRRVVAAWYLTMLVRQDPGFEEAMQDADKGPDELHEKVYTIKELRTMLSG